MTVSPPRIEGVSIFPDGRAFLYDELILIITTGVMLFSRKLWFVVGFFMGWYFSDYMGLYSALGLPVPAE